MRQWCAWMLAALAWPGAVVATENVAQDAVCEAAYAALPAGTILDLLDPVAPLERRNDALVAYERLATMQACPEFGYTLGQLYRHGEYLPGNLLPQDLDKARALILPMAESGYLPAFADMAEMEMRHANPREAMKWTQVYLSFVDKVQLAGVKDGNDIQYQRSAYNGNLLARVELIWKHSRLSLSRKWVNQDFNAYLTEHGAAVLQRMQARQQGQGLRVSAQDGGDTHVTRNGDRCHVNAIDRIGAASAAWIVEVLPSGQTGRFVLENFVPKPEVATRMHACLEEYAFAPSTSGQPTTMRISMVMGSTEGAAIRRRGR